MATTAKEHIELLKAALAKNVAVASVTVDGQTVQYDRDQAMKELAYWERQAGLKSGKRPLFRGFNISNTFDS